MTPRVSRKSKRREVAVVGYAVRLPGARNRQGFWQLLADERCAVSKIPPDRFPTESFYHPKARTDVPGRSYTFAAGVLDDVWSFDPTVFGISPREAAQMDPQQRHLLEVTYEAFEHAGLRPSQLAGSQTGVYVGASSSDYATRFMFDPAAVDVHMMTGNTLSIISNRLSYCFDLRGPSFTVDTACSSSLVAMHVALEAIREGKIDTAVVGGVNMLLSPFSFVGFARASMLSPTGLCKAFDASGDGYVRGEGAVAVVLRAADVAQRNGNPIHAVVVGSGINQDGRTSGLSLPSWEAQAALLERVYREFDVAPDALAFVEAHGTGTRVGDPAEAESLGTVLGQRRKAPLPIGSVKTNIGHLEPASGLAGFVKSVMALEHDLLPASLHFREPNPDIRFDELNLRVAAQPLKLPKGRGLRHAGVNSFGFGGANAHVVLREASRTQARAAPKTNGAASPPLILSAHSADALKALAEQYGDTLRQPGITAASVANAAAHTRDLLPERLVVVGGRLDAALAAHVSGETSPSMWRGKALGNSIDAAFVFAGNGAQWTGMGLSAYQANAAFRDALQRFDARFTAVAGWSAIEALQSPNLAVEIRRASRVQPLLLGLQVATVEALAVYGLEPAMAMGHSVGEIAAAWCAGGLDLDSAIRVVLSRSRRQEVTRHQGGMAAVLVSASEMAALLERDAFEGLEIAAINSARSVTVAGPTPALDSFIAYAEQERWGVRRLDIDYPYHCALVDLIEPRLLEDLADVKPGATRIPLISTVTGEEIEGEALDARYWWQNVRRPVSFEAGMRSLCQRGAQIFVEVGPRQVLGGYLNDALRRQSIQGAVIDTLGRDSGEHGDEIRAAVARVLVAGGRVDLDRFVGPCVRPAAELPGYAWQRRVIGFPETREAFGAYAPPPHPLLGSALRPDAGDWFASIDPQLFPWLEDHRVEDTAVFPAAGFVEIALAAARQKFGSGALEVRDLEILQPLVFDGVRSFELMTRISHDTNVLEIRSRPRPGGDEWSLHVQVSIAQAPVADAIVPPLAGEVSAVFDADQVYRLAQRRGLMYGPAFRKAGAVEVIGDRTAHMAFVTAEPVADHLILDPTVLDAAFHVSFPLAEMDADLPPDARFLPIRVGSIRVFRPGARVSRGQCCITMVTSRSRVADFVLFDGDGNVVAQAVQVRFRTAPRAARETMDSLAYKTGFVRLHAPSQASGMAAACGAGAADVLAHAALASGGVEEARDVSLVLDAAARVAAYAAIKDILATAPASRMPELVAAGHVAMSSWPLASRLLQALSEDGVATESDQGWRLSNAPDLPTIGELVDVLLTRYPAWVAEATCLARLPEILPGLLREGLDQGIGLGNAVREHLESGSPAVLRLSDMAQRAALDIVAKWPQTSPLSILVVGVLNLPMATRLAPVVAAINGRVVVTDLDDESLKAASLGVSDAAARGLQLVEWNEAIDGRGGYDLVVCARTLHRVAVSPGRLDLLARAIRKGGALIAAEPAPSLFADLVYGNVPSWWAGSVNPDFPVGAILSGRDWQQALESAGLQAVTVQSAGGEAAAGLLLSAVASGRAETTPIISDLSARSMILVADSTTDSHVLADLLQPRLATAGRVVPLRASGGTHVQRGSRRVRLVDLQEAEAAAGAIADQVTLGAITDVIFVAVSRVAADDPVARLSRQSMTVINLAKALAGTSTVRLWIVCSGALNGVVDGQAPNPVQCGLWAMARVIQNEFAEIDVRCVDVDPSLASDAAASRVAEVVAEPGEERELRLDAHGRSAPRLLRGGILPEPRTGPVGENGVMRLAFDRAGQSDGFVWRSLPRRPPQAGEVEIDVAATGLNFRDVMWSLGLLPDEALENGFTGPAIGMECAGVVRAVGSGVDNLRIGDRVVAFAGNAFASRVTVGRQTVARIPDGVSSEAAATLPVAFLTAYYALVHLARLEAGETVLIHGGAGGVGLAALQIAKLRGAKVIATAGSPDRRALLRELGADHVFDSRSLAFVDDVSRVTGGAGVEVVLNSLAAEAMERSVDCLKPFGRFLELGKRDFYTNRHLGLRPFRNNLSYFGIDADQLLGAHASVVEKLFGELMGMFASGQLVPLPYRVFEADDVGKAFRLMQRSGHIGKILVRPPKLPPQARVPTPFAVDPHGLYLIVGGLGGFGLATAQWLAAKGARHLAVVSRSGKPSDQATEALRELKSSGVQVEVAAVDVGDPAALERYLLTVKAGPAPLKGVFHTAMVIDDGLARDLDRGRMEAVLRPKVAGAYHLDRLTRRFDLDCFVLFSSATVLVGNPGQANYVAANAYLEGLAQRRRAEGLPALAVSWGAIGDVGYLARNAAVNKVLAQRLGGAALSAGEALAGLDALLSLGNREVHEAALGYARMDWALIRKELPIAKTSLFGELRLPEATADGTSMAAEELMRMLRELPEAEVHAKLADLIVGNITRTLRLPTADIDRNRALSELGMDSLMMLELRAAVEESMGIEIPLMSLTSSLTVIDISKRLAAMLRTQENALMSAQMSALTQGHLQVPEVASDAQVATAAAAVAQRAKTVEGIL